VLQPRRADSTEVIGAALACRAEGLGHRRIAAVLGRSPSTVCRWLRRARGPGHLNRLWQRGAQELIRLDADAFNQLASTGNLLRDTLTVLAAAAWWARRRLGIASPCRHSSGSTPAGAFSRRPAEPFSGPAHRRARGIGCPAPPVTMNTNIRRHAVTVNTITSACTSTTGCSFSPKVTLSYPF
jgi:hypothetical protein